MEMKGTAGRDQGPFQGMNSSPNNPTPPPLAGWGSINNSTGIQMSLRKLGGAALALALIMVAPMTTSAQSKGKVLVVMSRAHELDLRDGNWRR